MRALQVCECLHKLRLLSNFLQKEHAVYSYARQERHHEGRCGARYRSGSTAASGEAEGSTSSDDSTPAPSSPVVPFDVFALLSCGSAAASGEAEGSTSTASASLLRVRPWPSVMYICIYYIYYDEEKGDLWNGLSFEDQS